MHQSGFFTSALEMGVIWPNIINDIKVICNNNEITGK